MIAQHGAHQPTHNDPDTDENTTGQRRQQQQQHTRQRSKAQQSPALWIPRNGSTGNLLSSDLDTSARIRLSMDATSAAEYESFMRSPIMTEHDHGLGISGLRRIRQQPLSRIPTIPSSVASSSNPTGGGLPRSASMGVIFGSQKPAPYPPGQSSLNFSEDLSRFPSESLHSFSFAHQSEEFMHNRQNVLKRSLEFMRDRMCWTVSSSTAALASARARVTGDVEAQSALDLLARAQLIEAGNLPNASSLVGPLTGPALASDVNPFDNNFFPRSASPESILPSATRGTLASPESSDIEPTPSILNPLENLEKTQLSAEAQTSLSTTDPESETASCRTPTNECRTTAQTSPPSSRPTIPKRTLTDTLTIAVQERLMDTLAQPFLTGQPAMPEPIRSPTLSGSSINFPSALGPAVHGHTNRWVPAAQAIFTTEAKPPWTILAANDLACLVFGVTKSEMRKVGILEVVQEERRDWLERKLFRKDGDDGLAEIASAQPTGVPPNPGSPVASSLLGGRLGITAQLLSKPNSRSQTPRYSGKRAQTVHIGDSSPPKTNSGHQRNPSKSVILCGDVVPIQKRNGATGSASLWVKEKKVGLIWVLEEIHEDVAIIALEDEGVVRSVSGSTAAIWGFGTLAPGVDVGKLIPRIPRQGIDPRTGEIDFAQIARRKFFTCPIAQGVNIPCKIEQVRGKLELRVSSFPHMAGIVVVCPEDLKIKSSNSVFCGALFGHEKPDCMPISSLIPDFEKILHILTEDEETELVDGIVVPEHSFRKASASLGLREGRPGAAVCFLRPEGLSALHRDGSDLRIDVQMRVVKSEKQIRTDKEVADHQYDEHKHGAEVVYALWITHSRHLHSQKQISLVTDIPVRSEASSPLHQPSPGQTSTQTPRQMTPDPEEHAAKRESNGQSAASMITKQIRDVAMTAAAKLTGASRASQKADKISVTRMSEPAPKKSMDDFIILEDMGQGAYGQVKLARYKTSNKKVVLKYVTKRRILVDTWTRDRKLGTVPLEIHVLDFLRRPELRHPNVVEMESFFEDDVNYYIEMVPHGLPGMDLFDYIELRSNMEEDECRSIFVQVARAIHHLHTKAHVVHRDIKDENVILDGEGNIKLIDFGSAAYIKSGPFDVFVGTIDYAAPEVLAGKPYHGREQDVWALGILLYTIIYKENPFYSIDEIMDRDLRVPFTTSNESIDLVRHMLDRDLIKRFTIEQVVEHPWCRAD